MPQLAAALKIYEQTRTGLASLQTLQPTARSAVIGRQTSGSEQARDSMFTAGSFPTLASMFYPIVCAVKHLMLSNARNRLARRTGSMKQMMLKALLIADEKENSWLLNGGFYDSMDCSLIDLESLGVHTEDLQHALQTIAEQGEVLLMDSALAWNFVFKVALRMRGKMPNFPILLLPNTHAPEGALLTIKGGLMRNGRRYGRWTPMVRKLGGYAAAVATKIKDLAPYAVMALVVPGGSTTAPLLWFYRRQKKIRALRIRVSQPVEPTPSYEASRTTRPKRRRLRSEVKQSPPAANDTHTALASACISYRLLEKLTLSALPE